MSHQIKVEDFIHDEFTGLLASGDGKRLTSVVRFPNGGVPTLHFCVRVGGYREYFTEFDMAVLAYNLAE